MDKAIIFGIYDFVSFHTCKALLNKGLEVIGIHIDGIDKYPFLEEKRLEVGRNANFSELSLSEWENRREQDSTKTTFIFSIYDLYMLNKDTILLKEEVTRPILQFMEDNHNNTDVILILPIQMLTSNQEKTINEFLTEAKGWAENKQLFYLPAIYGPWQPSSFTFQQVILSKLQNTEITKNDREWTKDALYVNDAVEAILEINETSNPKKEGYLLESGKPNYWTQCAAYLQIDENPATANRYEPIQIDQHIVRVTVKKVTPFADSINKQVEHVQRLYPNQP